jgi:hypothetical protein
LPGQVHTYFAGSDQNVFRGYKKEVDALEEKGNFEYVCHATTFLAGRFLGVTWKKKSERRQYVGLANS